jgi:hypothetical protein
MQKNERDILKNPEDISKTTQSFEQSEEKG